MSSIAPPKALAPIKTGRSPMRPVRASGKASAAKAMKCNSLSMPSGARGGASGPEHCDRQDERHGDCQWDVGTCASAGVYRPREAKANLALCWTHSRLRKTPKIRGLGVDKLFI